MSKYLDTKKGSLEDMVAGVTEGKQSEDYKQLFKKELEKAGKGVGAMSDQEKKNFFNKIDKMHTAKNEEGSKEIQIKNKKTGGEKEIVETKNEPVKDKPDYKSMAESIEEGGVKDFLMDVEADAGDMSLNDLIKKYYGQMGLSAQDIKKIYYRVNESVNEESEEDKEEVKSVQDTVLDVWNQAADEKEKIESEAKWLKTESKDKKEDKKDKDKKTMTGSKATKVDTEPEVDFDSK